VFQRQGNFGVLAVLAASTIVLSGCALKGDVKRLETEVMLLRAEASTGDSLSVALFTQLIIELEQLQNESRSYLDSLRTELAGVRNISGELRGSLRSLEAQMITLEELVGSSQATLQQLERRLGSGNPAPTVEPAAPVESPADDPRDLFELGRRQFNQGSVRTARLAFARIVDQHPDSDLMPDALYWLAASYAQMDVLDSAVITYRRLISDHSNSDRVPEAFYRLGLLAAENGNIDAAINYFQTVVTRFPNSAVADLARERLRPN